MNDPKNEDWMKYIPPFARQFVPTSAQPSQNYGPPSNIPSNSVPQSNNQNADWLQFVPAFARGFIPQQQTSSSFSNHYYPSSFGSTSSSSGPSYGPLSVQELKENVQVFGPLSVKGDATGSFDVNGPATIEGNINNKNISVRGYFTFGKNLFTENLTWIGFMSPMASNSEGNIQVEKKLDGTGGFRGKVVTAEEIRVKQDSGTFSSAKGLFAEKSVTITSQGGQLETEYVVSGKGDVTLERVKAQMVRGNRVSLTDCQVDKVIYGSSFETRNSVVGSSLQDPEN